MDSSSDLNEHLQRASAGNLDAFAEIIRVFQKPLCAWIVSRCPPNGDADDVAQKTFIAAYNQIGEIGRASCRERV